MDYKELNKNLEETSLVLPPSEIIKYVQSQMNYRYTI